MPRTKTIDDSAVLDAAIGVIHREGPARLTLASVAAEVGLAPATLVQRFSSKRGLLLAVARRGREDAGAPVREALERHGSPLAGLAAGLVAMSASVSSPDAMANSMAFLQIDLSDPEFHALALAHAEELRAAIGAALEAARSSGEIGEDVDVERLSRAVQTTYNGALITWAIYRRGPLRDWLASELETLLAPHRSG